jgi:hypothetical protein
MTLTTKLKTDQSKYVTQRQFQTLNAVLILMSLINTIYIWTEER